MYLHVFEIRLWKTKKDEIKKETKTTLKVICFHQGVVKEEFIIVGDEKSHEIFFFVLPFSTTKQCACFYCKYY